MNTEYEKLPDIPVSFIIEEINSCEVLLTELRFMYETDGIKSVRRKCEKYKKSLNALLQNYSNQLKLREYENSPAAMERRLRAFWKIHRNQSDD